MRDYANVFPNNLVTDLGTYTYTSQNAERYGNQLREFVEACLL